MFRVLPCRLLLLTAFLIAAATKTNQVCLAQGANSLMVKVSPPGKNTTQAPPDTTPSVFMQVGSTQRITFKAQPPGDYHPDAEMQARRTDTWQIGAFNPNGTAYSNGIKTKPDKDFDYKYYGAPYSVTHGASGMENIVATNTGFDLNVVKGNPADPTVKETVNGNPVDVINGAGLEVTLDFTPKQPGYWAIQIYFKSVWAEKSAAATDWIPVASYVGQGTAYLVTAQATIVTSPPSVTNVIVGQQLNLSATILPKDIDTTSKTSTTYDWTVPNDPLTGWDFAANDKDCHARKSPLSTDPTISPTNNTKLPNVTFFWYHNGSNSGTTQTVSTTISDPAWTGGNSMPISLTPTQNFTLYQPSNTFVATPVAKPKPQLYTILDSNGNASNQYQIGLGRRDGVFPIPPSYLPPPGQPQYGIVFTVPDPDSLLQTPAEQAGLSGTFGWCQIVEKFEGYAINGTTKLSLAKITAPALDGSSIADSWSYPVVGPSQSQAADSPTTPTIDGFTSVNVNQGFTMYLMYTPPGNGSFPVPLRKMTWSWIANFAFDPINNAWVDQGGSSNTPNSQTSDDQPASDYPTWTDWMHNYFPFKWN